MFIDEDIRNLWRTHDDVIDFARAIEAMVREECKAEWQKGFDEGTIAGYESGQTDMREECAVICEDKAVQLRDDGMFDYGLVAMDCAEAIRAKGKE